MEVYERINYLLKKQKITKRAFAKKLRSLEPKLRITGETPSENTIYSYLSGRITIPIELIPYIAEALDITEQELFDASKLQRKRCFKYFLKNATRDELIKSIVDFKLKNDGLAEMVEVEEVESLERKIAKLLKYAPPEFIQRVLKRLEEFKTMSQDF